MSKSIWDIYAPIYNRIMKKDKDKYKIMYDRIKNVVNGKEVLEIATGTGILAKNIVENTKKIIATDYSQGMIKEAKKGAYSDKLIFEIADAKKLPYNDDEFDVVIIANALHVMPEPEVALKEIKRVLKNNGILIAPNFIKKQNSKFDKLWFKILKIFGINFQNEWTYNQFLKFLEKNGWDIKYNIEIKSRVTIAYTECKMI